MEIEGRELIPAPRAVVWQALNDEAVLQESIPGCRTLVREGENVFRGTVTVKIGVVNATFAGTVKLADVMAPSSYTIIGEGKGGIAGFAKGSCKVSLFEVDEHSTWLVYAVRTEVGGKLASLGSRLLDGVARKLTGKFFAAFMAQLQAQADAG